LILTATTFALFILMIAPEIIDSINHYLRTQLYAERSVSFGNSNPKYGIPLPRYFIFLILPLIYKAKTYFFSTLLTSVSFISYYFEFTHSNRDLGFLDYSILALTSILFFWQVSIIFRFVLKSFQPKFIFKYFMTYVSTKKQNWLLNLSFLLSCLLLAGFVYNQIQEHNAQVAEVQRQLLAEANGGISFSMCVWYHFSWLPVAKVFLFFLLPINYYSKKYTISSLLTITSILVFILDFISHIQGLLANESYDTKSVFEMAFMVASPFDYLIFVLLSVLLFLQLSIIVRFIINRFQSKSFLV
jgi:hypothetical protein